ncbi:MAG: DUF2341 domain-containing protein, partial [Ignavibacteriaceae bacterium]
IPGGNSVMNKTFTKFNLLITIGILSILFSAENIFAQNPGNALDFNGGGDPDGRYGFVNAPNAPALNMTSKITIEGWFKPSSSSWAYKKLITIDYTKVSSTLTDFPVLVSVTDDELKDSDNGGQIQPDGDDILFILTDGTRLSHEIEKYDGSIGQLVAWVKIPSLSSSADTEFYLYYGNSTCSSQQDTVNVWDSNYKGIWHLEENGDGSVDEFRDRTINGNHGRGGNGDTSMVPNQTTLGKISNAQDFDASDDFILVDYSESINITDDITISAWIKRNVLDDYGDIISKTDGGAGTVYDYTFFIAENAAPDYVVFWSDQTTPIYLVSDDPIDTTKWYYVVVTRSGSTVAFYIDGIYSGGGTMTGTFGNDPNPLLLGDSGFSGGGEFNGMIDEVRVSNSPRDSSWIATEYRNQNSPSTFMSFSNQTAAGISKSLAYGISTNNSKVFGTINNQSVSGSINASEWNHICLTYDKDAGGTDEMKLYLNGTQSSTGDYSTAISTNSNNLLLGDMIGFIGEMDEIRLWNDVRTQMEIRENMHITLTPELESNLVAYWKLDESSGTLVMDSKGTNHGTMTNMADSNRVASTAAFGGGLVNSTAGFTSGTLNLGTFSLTTTESFDNPVDIISTEILNAPNILPSVASPLNDRYWVVEVYGTPGSYTANVTFTLPTGYLQLGDEANLVLYNRSSTSDSSWSVLISGASSMTSTTVTFDGVSTLGQFTLGSTGSSLPVELLSFTGTVKDQKVYLNWITATEANNYGFEILRRARSTTDMTLDDEWDLLGFVGGNGTTTEIKKYSFEDKIEIPGAYLYKLKQIDFDGTFKYSQEIEVDIKGPIEFSLSQNYPNPFNPSTIIKFALPEKTELKISVYNSLGEKVAEAFKGELDKGYHQIEFNANALPSGVYFYRFESEKFLSVKKMILVK